MYKYRGHGESVRDVPARDLTDEEYAAHDRAEKAAGRSGLADACCEPVDKETAEDRRLWVHVKKGGE